MARPLSPLLARASRIDAATPPDRDRLIDLLRVVAMLVVAVGHWLAAAVVVAPDGAISTTNTLAVVPATRWLTLLLQVMGLFFVTSAWSSARSRAGRTGPWTAWYLTRLRRVLVPTAVYVAVWSVLAVLLASWLPADTAATAGRLAAVQLWFVAVIVAMFALTPLLYGLWRRHGVALPVAAVVAALAVDVAHRILGIPLVGWLNYLLVWSVPTLLGFAWHDGYLGRRAGRWLLAGGLAALAGLIATPWLPVAMVGVPGAARSNTSPPSVALVALTCVQLGAVLVAQDRLRALLRRPLAWAAVVGANLTAMTTYLWHLTALVGLVGLLRLTGGTGWLGAPGSQRWWLTRPVWLAALALLTVPLVVVLRRVERVRVPDLAPTLWRLAVATVAVVLGAAQLARTGFTPADGPTVAGLDVPAAALLVGAALVRAWPLPFRAGRDQPSRSSPSRPTHTFPTEGTERHDSGMVSGNGIRRPVMRRETICR